MKQGRTLLELGRELQRQRQNRQDFLADTRTLEVESTSYGSTLHLSLDGKTYGFGIGELAHQQIAALTRIDFKSLVEEKHFGDLTVQIEQDNLQDDDFDEEDYALAAPF